MEQPPYEIQLPPGPPPSPEVLQEVLQLTMKVDCGEPTQGGAAWDCPNKPTAAAVMCRGDGGCYCQDGRSTIHCDFFGEPPWAGGKR